MSGSRKENRRKTTPALKYGERKYFLVQFIEDSVKSIVTDSQIKREDHGITKAMYMDKRYYPCVVLSESEDKDQLIKMKSGMEKQGGSAGKKKKKDKQTGEKNKRKGPAVSKEQTKEDMLATAKEKEEKKREKIQKRKALDERDLNILGQMSQLNRSIVVVDEPRRETEEKEKELERKRVELERKEKEIQRKEYVVQEANLQERREQERVLEEMRCIVQGSSREDEDDEYDEENFDLDDNGQDLAGEIDVSEATSFIQNSEKSQPANEWPSVGMKRPRVHQRASIANKCPRQQNWPSCAECLHLRAELEELREANKLLTEQLSRCREEAANALQSSDAPRPGKVSRALAEKHHMIELSPGKSTYIYESHIIKASSKKTATATACFLLSCFYKDSELIGTSLSGKNGKKCLDSEIIDSILSYTQKKFPDLPSDSVLKIALRNKITCLEAKSRKKTTVN